jgi:hypothetical protein
VFTSNFKRFCQVSKQNKQMDNSDTNMLYFRVCVCVRVRAWIIRDKAVSHTYINKYSFTTTFRVNGKTILKQSLWKYNYWLFGNYPSSCFLFKYNVSETALSPSSGKNLLSWAQSIELVPTSGHQHQHKIVHINQAQHKPRITGFSDFVHRLVC